MADVRNLSTDELSQRLAARRQSAIVERPDQPVLHR